MDTVYAFSNSNRIPQIFSAIIENNRIITFGDLSDMVDITLLLCVTIRRKTKHLKSYRTAALLTTAAFISFSVISFIEAYNPQTQKVCKSLF